MSPELIDRIAWDNLLERSRISELGKLATGYAKPANPYKKGNPHTAGMFARMAAHQARMLFPDLFLWGDQRYGQQLDLTGEAA